MVVQAVKGERPSVTGLLGGSPDGQAGQIGIVIAPPDRQAGRVGVFEQFELLLLDDDLALARHRRAARFGGWMHQRAGRAKARQVEGCVIFFVSHVQRRKAKARLRESGSVQQGSGAGTTRQVPFFRARSIAACGRARSSMNGLLGTRGWCRGQIKVPLVLFFAAIRMRGTLCAGRRLDTKLLCLGALANRGKD
jgi:hypothetical protein